jgi:hypothetical protein
MLTTQQKWIIGFQVTWLVLRAIATPLIIIMLMIFGIVYAPAASIIGGALGSEKEKSSQNGEHE